MNFKTTQDKFTCVGGNSGHTGGSTTQNIFQLYVHHMTIQGEPGNYKVDVRLSWKQKLMNLFGKYPSAKQIEGTVRREMLGEVFMDEEESEL